MNLNKYDYQLPSELIAKEPASPRDHARLLVYERESKRVRYDRFYNLPKYLPPRSVLVLNDTKVLPARLTATKETGGKVRLLYVRKKGKCLYFLADRKLAIGSRVRIAPKIYFVVCGQNKGEYELRPSFPISLFLKILQKFGTVPIPPYIKQTPLSERKLKEKYQNIFAKNPGSIAAPTASLHFTKKLMANLKKSGVDTAFVTLHINLGTFAPLTETQIKSGKLHEEEYEVPEKTAVFLNKAKKEKRPIIAVGTTAVRTLESAADKRENLRKLRGATRLFIREGYKFKFADSLITNFHVPRSSLLMLVAAFCGRKNILGLYQKAIKRKFRFFSFGDGMLIL